ncbi:4Fe-4S binding protein [Candidatus Aerophobetes bacterium]|nr:4Fe-4S binding protein [Candidatus Aerophobetes bacterium]
MLIDAEKCVGCGRCQPYCPAACIRFEEGRSVIDQNKCLECGVCLRVEVCPVDAIYESPNVFEFPRSARKFFGDPATTHAETGIPGRGTDEVKTNDVTKRYKPGEIGIALEMGRPSVGAWMEDIEKAIETLIEAGFTNFEERNPVFNLITNKKTGELKEELKKERVLSAILEFKIKRNQLSACLKTIKQIAKKIDTVFSLDLITCFEHNLEIPEREVIEKEGFSLRKNAKINLGLGRRIQGEEE